MVCKDPGTLIQSRVLRLTGWFSLSVGLMSKDLRKQALTFEVIMIIKLIIKEVIVVVVICVS